MAKTDIQQLLIEWARWTHVGGVDIDYPHCTPFYRASKMGGWGAKLPRIDDEMAGRVDRAVASLELRCRHNKDDFRYAALEWEYLQRRQLYQLAEKCRVDRRRVSNALRAAESWVEGHVFTEEIMLAIVPR